MLCEKCGCPLENGAVFCGNCGAKVENPIMEAPAAPVFEQAPMSPAPQNPNNKHKLIGIIAVCVAAALVIALAGLFVLPAVFGGPERRAEKFLEAFFDGDADKALSYVHEDVIKAAAEEWDMTRREFIDMMQEELDWEMEELDEDCDHWSVEFEVKDTEEFKHRDIRDLQELYDEYDCDVEIKDAMEVELRMSLRCDGERERDNAYVTMVKIGAKWYVCPFSTDIF